MTTKITLDPENIPLVDIDFMNSTHFEELTIANELGEYVSQYQDGDTSEENAAKILELLNKWLEHTIPHFEHENQLMQETSFPAYQVHAGEHEAAIERFKAIISAWEDNKDIELISDYIFTQWPNWFNAHVNSMDMMTAKFAVANGFDPQATVS